MFNCYLDAIPRNAEDRKRLVECGYSVSLWEKVSGPLNCVIFDVLLIGAMYLVFQDISMVVKTDGSHSLEENMRQTLLACYAEFADILKQLAITHVSMNDSNCSSLSKFPRK